MNHSPDELEMRELFRRMKRSDEQQAPAFDDVLARPLRVRRKRPAQRLALVVACCTAATLLFSLLLVLPRDSDSVMTSDRQLDDNVVHPATDPRPDKHEADVDFDYLRQVVDEHFSATDTAISRGEPLWTSRTESLLAVNLNVSVP